MTVSQNARNRRNGAKFESDVTAYVRSRGLEAERLRTSGKLDEGDLTIRDKVGVAAVCELKSGKNLSVRRWWEEEAIPEAKNYASRRALLEPPQPALIMKSHNQSIGKSLVVISLDQYLALLGGSA